LIPIEPMTSRPLLLVDASALFVRSYHSLPAMTTVDGFPTSALYGLASTLIRLLGEQRPRATACALDGGHLPGAAAAEEPLRARAQRATPASLTRQTALARALAEALGFRTFIVPGVGAKEVLATLAVKLGGPQSPTLVVAGDHDLVQVVRPGVSVLLPGRSFGEGRVITPTEVMLGMGIPPALLAERDALAGNRASRIPGVPGVGPRTASRLLLRHGSIEGILRHLDDVKPERLRRALAEAAPHLLAHRTRLALRSDIPVVVDERALAMDWPRLEDAFAILERFEFRSLLPRLAAVMERGAARARS
jgi:DNA polymerase-1